MPPVGTDRTFTFAASADAKIYEYDLRVEDALHNVQRTKVRVVETPAGEKPPSPLPPPAAAGGAGAGIKTPLVLDEKNLKAFADSIQGQIIEAAGLKIVVDTVTTDLARKIVTAKIKSAQTTSGAKVTDDALIIDALITKGDGIARGVRPANVSITR